MKGMEIKPGERYTIIQLRQATTEWFYARFPDRLEDIGIRRKRYDKFIYEEVYPVIHYFDYTGYPEECTAEFACDGPFPDVVIRWPDGSVQVKIELFFPVFLNEHEDRKKEFTTGYDFRRFWEVTKREVKYPSIVVEAIMNKLNSVYVDPAEYLFVAVLDDRHTGSEENFDRIANQIIELIQGRAEYDVLLLDNGLNGYRYIKGSANREAKSAE